MSLDVNNPPFLQSTFQVHHVMASGVMVRILLWVIAAYCWWYGGNCGQRKKARSYGHWQTVWASIWHNWLTINLAIRICRGTGCWAACGQLVAV